MSGRRLVFITLAALASFKSPYAQTTKSPPKPVQILGRPRWSPFPGKLAVAFSPDNRMLYAAGQGGIASLRIADGATRIILRNKRRMTALLPLIDDTHLLAGDDSGALQEINLANGIVSRRIEWGKGAISGIALSSDGKRLAVMRMNRLQLGEFDAGKPAADRELTEYRLTGTGLPPPDEPWLSVRFNGNGLVEVRSHDGAGTLYDAKSGEKIDLSTTAGKQRLKAEKTRPFRYLSVEYNPLPPRIFLTEDGVKSLVPRAAYQSQVNFSFLSPSGETLISDPGAYSVHERAWTPMSFPLKLYTASFSSDDRWLAASDFSGLALIDLKTGREQRWAYSLTNGYYGSLDYSPDGKFLAGAESSRRLIVWRISDGRAVLSLANESNYAFPYLFLANGKLIFVQEGRQMHVAALKWDGDAEITSWKVDAELDVRSITTTPDRARFMVAADEADHTRARFRLYDAKAMTVAANWTGPLCLSGAGTGKLFGNRMVCDSNRDLALFDELTGARLKTLASPSDNQTLSSAAIFMKNGSLISLHDSYLGPPTNSGEIFPLETLQVFRPPEYGESGKLTTRDLKFVSGSISEDGRILATSVWGKETLLYDLNTRRISRRLKRFPAWYETAALSPDLRHVAVLFHDGHVEIFSLSDLGN